MPASIRCRFRRYHDHTGCLRLRDSGTGIEPQHLTRIFEPFRHSASRIRHNSEGTGLGLTVSKKLLEPKGGDNGD